MRPLHCTQLGLRPADSPNVGTPGAQFLVEGVCVRAAPELAMKGNCETLCAFLVARCVLFVVVYMRHYVYRWNPDNSNSKMPGKNFHTGAIGIKSII